MMNRVHLPQTKLVHADDGNDCSDYFPCAIGYADDPIIVIIIIIVVIVVVAVADHQDFVSGIWDRPTRPCCVGTADGGRQGGDFPNCLLIIGDN
jgi:hypothetical protein